MNARERADKLMDQKRLVKYPELVRKNKRLRQQIRDLNRCIRKLKADVDMATGDAIQLARAVLDRAERDVMAELEASSHLTFPRPRGTFLS